MGFLYLIFILWAYSFIVMISKKHSYELEKDVFIFCLQEGSCSFYLLFCLPIFNLYTCSRIILNKQTYVSKSVY